MMQILTQNHAPILPSASLSPKQLWERARSPTNCAALPSLMLVAVGSGNLESTGCQEYLQSQTAVRKVNHAQDFTSIFSGPRYSSAFVQSARAVERVRQIRVRFATFGVRVRGIEACVALSRERFASERATLTILMIC